LITNWKSFYNLLKYEAFEIQQINNFSKKERFLQGFKNHRNTQKLIRLSPFKNKEFTANDWKYHYNLKSYISSHKYLRSLIEENILITSFVHNKKYFYLNSSKLEELEKIWKL